MFDFFEKIYFLWQNIFPLYKFRRLRYNENMYIADLHIHSKYSRATSRSGDVPNLDLWARRKGIGLVGTGDFTHPAWREELADSLKPAEEGLYVIKDAKRLTDFRDFAAAPRFVISGEISCIYKQDGKVRKVHNVILLPSPDAAERLSLKLEEIGNIRSDGRPILGLSSRDLLAVTLDICPDAVFIPAHIWTPHFSLFGAFSGFDSVEECFGDLAGHVRALETGLSSDPPMNSRVALLDGYTMVSNSDAHSPSKLGRECNLIDTDMSYPALKKALETGEGFGGTIEFFPEEGKYHLDGHRACNLRLTPEQTRSCGGKCPVCGKKITVGVLNRLEQLAVRSEDHLPPSKPFVHLMPLPEVIAASHGTAAGGEKTERTYIKLLQELGAETDILRRVSYADIRNAGGERLAEGIRRLREGRVIKAAGFDGEYGTISLFTPDELRNLSGQYSFLGALPAPQTEAAEDIILPTRRSEKENETAPAKRKPGMNPAQAAAAGSRAAVTAVIAGPGTGKTFTLVERIAGLVESGVDPAEITAVTFTVRAAAEMRGRLAARLRGKAKKITVGTFHAICYSFLSDRFALANRAYSIAAAQEIVESYGLKMSPSKFIDHVSLVKNGGRTECGEAVRAYTRKLRAAGMLDYDDLIAEALAAKIAAPSFRYLHVDEFQDVNPAQYELISLWLAGGCSLFAIGDPDQAIYAFRGAGENCFARLLADCPAAVTVRLTENYRSTPEVLDCALSVIGHNGGERALTACAPAGAAVRLVECASGLSEGIFIAKEIARMCGGLDMLGKGREERVRGFGDIAVLARTHRQLEQIKYCLRKEDIPCMTAGRTDFLEAPSVAGTLAFFRALAGDGAAEKQAVAYLCGADNFAAAKELFLPLLGQRPRRILEKWRDHMHICSRDFDMLADAAHYADMAEFLERLTLGKDGDVTVSDGSPAAGAVRLSTLHGAKGLEFPVVFLCGLNGHFLPSPSAGGAEEVREERRLFYVGITRAAGELILTTYGKPSVFLSELPPSVRREKEVHKQVYRQLSMF